MQWWLFTASSVSRFDWETASLEKDVMSHKKRLLVRFGRFCAIGMLNTLLHLLFFSGVYMLGAHYLIAQFVAFILVNLTTFWLNRLWTFNSKDPAVGAQIARYYFTRSLALAVTLLQTMLLVEKGQFSPFVGQVAAAAINVLLNFIFSQIFVFKPVQKELSYYLNRSYGEMTRLRNGVSVNVFYIVPVFREHHRLYPPSPENPNGEDFVRVKVEQLESLHEVAPQFQWRLIFVDDGDRVHRSGQLVRERIQDLYPEKLASGQMRVWFLDDLAPEIAASSRKGGAVMAAFRQMASMGPKPSDIVVYSDADISSDLRLSGSLFAPLLDGADLCLSSRWHEAATVVNRGIKQKISSWVYNLLVLLLLDLDYTDTQNGFKAMRYDIVSMIAPYLCETGFAFDTEILMLVQLFGRQIEEIPIFWKDSSAESNVSMLIDPIKAIGGLMRQRRYRQQLSRTTLDIPASNPQMLQVGPQFKAE